MGNTNQDGRLRLESLVFTASGIPRSGREIDLVLTWAAQGKTRLYVTVPETDAAYADPDFSGASKPSRVEMRTFKVNGSQLSAYVNKPTMSMQPDRDSPVTTLAGEIHPEVTHLALGTWHAEELRTKCHATLDIFPTCLMPYPNATLAQQGWLVPGRMPSALRMCSKDKVANGVVTSNLGSKSSLHRELSDSPAVVEQKNILIDALLENELKVKLGELQEDPYGLRDGAYGVYLLYCAADNFYHLLVNEQVDLKDVERWVSSKEPSLFRPKTLKHHAVKLLGPRHRRWSGARNGDGSGSGKTDKRKLRKVKKVRPEAQVRPEVIAPEIFRPGYKRPDFVTDGLALLIVVALWWIDEWGSTPKSRTVVKGWRTSNPAWRSFAASLGCGAARCIRTHPLLRYRVLDRSCDKSARA